METYEIEYMGINLIVEGYYYKGSLGDWETPPDPQEVEIQAIYVSDVNIIDLLEEHIKDLENLILNKYYE